MKKLLLLLIIPIFSFGQIDDFLKELRQFRETIENATIIFKGKVYQFESGGFVLDTILPINSFDNLLLNKEGLTLFEERPIDGHPKTVYYILINRAFYNDFFEDLIEDYDRSMSRNKSVGKIRDWHEKHFNFFHSLAMIYHEYSEMSFFIKTRSELESMNQQQLEDVVYNFRNECIRFKKYEKKIEHFSEDNEFYRIRIDDIPNYVFH